MATLDELRKSVIEGNAGRARALVLRCLEEREPAETVLARGLIAAMDEVGQRFECGQFYIPEMLIAARAMKAGLEPLRPLLGQKGAPRRGRIAIGTVEGDLHDIGKNLVAMMLEGAGFEVTDLGTNVTAEAFVAAARAGADVLAVSALLTTTMTRIPGVVDAVRAAGLRDRVKVIVGGAQMTDAFAREADADGYAPDASRAAELARRLLGAR